jgi:hypothetical protein
MAEIRPFERDDLSAVAALLRANLAQTPAEEQIAQGLGATFLDDPWRDEELPSLVATEEGDVIGFIASQVRRFRLDDRVLRAVAPSHLTVAAGRRGGAAGALLLRRLLTAGQDFTYSDTANDEVARMWQAFGGHLDPGRACDWMIVLRPVRWLRTLTVGTIGRRLEAEQIPVGAFPFQAARPRIGRRAFLESEPEVSGEDVDAAAIVEHLPEMAARFRLRADYEERFLDYLFGEIESMFGQMTRRLVRRAGRPIGWYASVPRPGGVSRILHILTSEPNGDAVLGELVDHARERKSNLITGRLEPHLTQPLLRRTPVLGFARRPLIHSQDLEIRAALATSSSLLTQLDGEWFLTGA